MIIRFIPPLFSRFQVLTPTEPYLGFVVTSQKILISSIRLVVGSEPEHTCFQSQLWKQIFCTAANLSLHFLHVHRDMLLFPCQLEQHLPLYSSSWFYLLNLEYYSGLADWNFCQLLVHTVDVSQSLFKNQITEQACAQHPSPSFTLAVPSLDFGRGILYPKVILLDSNMTRLDTCMQNV